MSYEEEPLTLRQAGRAAVAGVVCLVAFAVAVAILPPLFRGAASAVVDVMHTAAAPSDHEE